LLPVGMPPPPVAMPHMMPPVMPMSHMNYPHPAAPDVPGLASETDNVLNFFIGIRLWNS
jgi:hypothetical protein